MKILGFNISRAQQKSLSAASVSWMRGEDVDNGSPALSNAYQQVVWVYRAINVLAEQVANIPFLFSAGQRGSENLITRGPLLEFYDHPHPQMNRFEYWELRIIWLMLRGECFRIPIYSDASGLSLSSSNVERSSRASGRRPDRVLILDPAHFQHIVQDHQLIGWRYAGFGPQTPLASQLFLPEEVWFEKLPNPFDFWRGMAPLHAAATAARTDFAAAAFMRGIIENNADVGLIVRTEKPLGPEQEQQLLACLRDRKRKAGLADRPVLLSGAAEVIKPQLSSTDLQFLENRKFSRAEICAAFGVPEEILTATDHAKYDVMQGARQNFIENRVAPLCRRLEAGEDQTVKAIDPAASGWFDLESLPIMQQCRQARLVSARTGFEMGIPFNELNRVLDLGFKTLPWGDTGYVPGKMQSVGVRPGKSLDLPRRARNEGELSQSLHQRATDFLSSTLIDQESAEAARGAAEADARHSASPERVKVMTGKLRKFFFEQRGRVLKVLADHCRPDVSPVPLTIPVPLDPFLSIENQLLTESLSPLLFADFELAAAQLRHEIGPATSPPASAKECVEKLADRLTAINQVTFTALNETLHQGSLAGETHAQLADRVKHIYNHASDHRAHSIAVAQTMSALAAAAAAASNLTG